MERQLPGVLDQVLNTKNGFWAGWDIVVRGEGDKTAPLVSKAIINKDSLEDVKRNQLYDRWRN